MILIPGGTFHIGADDLTPAEQPVHPETVAGFWMDITEVTVDAYKQCVDGAVCSKPDTSADHCTWGVSNKGSHPINCVDLGQANNYCAWALKRLPTEIEWEYAATHGADQEKFPWGNDPPDKQLSWSPTSPPGGGTNPVGSFSSGNTKDGLQDMAGNVYEWTASAKCTYLASGGYDPSCNETNYIVRGGSWDRATPSDFRCAARGAVNPSNRLDGLGFRCAKSP
jgi:formylglycine-generating enzyme required for sulfatase activity